jgi:hypothetical protein
MQEVENYITEYEAQTMQEEGRAEEFLLDVMPNAREALSEEEFYDVVEFAKNNWYEWAGDVWDGVHDKIYKVVDELRDKWLEKWDEAVARYLTGAPGLSEAEKEEAYDLLTDEEDGAFWAYMEEAGHGVGAYDCESGNWAELCEMGIDGAADILKLMPSDFTLDEQLRNDAVWLGTEHVMKMIVEETI